MLKSLTLFSLLAALPLANAQSADPTPQATQDQSQPPAPIVRSHQQHRLWRQQEQIVESQPIPGVWLRSESSSATKTISATAQRTEIGLDHGRLNVNIHQPAQHSEILIDLLGGQGSSVQVSLLKDGLYTFNADTGTVRVLRGEAAYLGPVVTSPSTKPIKIKEGHQLSLTTAPGLKPVNIRSVEAYPYELTADLLPPSSDYANRAYSDGPDYPPYDYPYAYYSGLWGYPGYYSYGYPFVYGVGIGYYGGFGGGYRGGFRR